MSGAQLLLEGTSAGFSRPLLGSKGSFCEVRAASEKVPPRVWLQLTQRADTGHCWRALVGQGLARDHREQQLCQAAQTGTEIPASARVG